MSGTEWILVVLVILVPAAIAVVVTRWTLEQAMKRSRKNRTQRPAQPVETAMSPPDSAEH